MVGIGAKNKIIGAHPGIKPGITYTQSKYHTAPYTIEKWHDDTVIRFEMQLIHRSLVQLRIDGEY